MLLNYYLLIVIAALLSLGIAFLLFRLFSKNKKYTRGGVIAFFAVLFIFTGIMMLNSRAYVVKGTTDVTRYVVYGTPEFKMTNGSTVKLEVPIQKCMIINDSEEDLLVQKVVYGSYGNKRPKVNLVASFSGVVVNFMSLDHIFDNKPPRQISTKSSGTVVKSWLRTKKEYENDYGPILTDEQIKKLREALKNKQE